MRCVVTLSLPKELCSEVEKQMKKHKFENKSEFIRHVLRFWLEHQDKGQSVK
ncbi:ribbon-helix-helix protein, CopG family [Candidatus Falkowbacteria bacterium]|jgi:Arc/MetJ-type ribon-helix-helix transcriptional regulator|nr:ribbon-helix-helix protein, CopG family [Candidatus Falkowbacteria bacterium]MBT7006979.1 ribbon-helix-helix protein, CopG family [Candidatus Falkowbacteria bacterium]